MSDHDDRKLRQAAAAAGHIAGDGSACPDAGTLHDSAGGRLSTEEQEQVILHLSECGACSSAWRVARELTAAPSRSRAPLYALATAAAVILAAALGLWLAGRGGEPVPPTYRTQESRWIQSELDGAALPRGAFTLRWTAGPEGSSYDLTVTRVDLERVHRARELHAAAFTIPAADLEGIPSGTRLLWQVTVRLPDGATEVSTTFVTTVE